MGTELPQSDRYVEILLGSPLFFLDLVAHLPESAGMILLLGSNRSRRSATGSQRARRLDWQS